MTIQENISLAQYTTFKIGGNARYFCIVKDAGDVKEAVSFAHDNKLPFFVLGGGSNILVSDKGFDGLVIKVEIEGKKKLNIEDSKLKTESAESAVVSAGAGEIWDSFVEWTIEQGFNGLENLSAIPGTVGAAPVQNIGAYGAEVSQFIHTVYAFDSKAMKDVSFTARDCHFGYRNSLFKHEKGRYVVTSVDFVLKKDGKVNIEYKDLEEYFTKKNDQSSIINDQITPAIVREAVIDIRWKKLPDWNLWGTAGSFFKNPITSKEKFDELKAKYPELPGFPEPSNLAEGRPEQVKIPLGWVLDHICHAKGMSHGNVGTYEKQALVIITKPGVKAAEVVEFTHELMKMVKDAIGVTIEAEVEWVN